MASGASERLGIGVRQFKRLVRSGAAGDAGLVSRHRGRPSNNRLPPGERARIVELLRDKYPDFGPTLAVEKLLERDGITVSAETIRQMQIAMGCGVRRSVGRNGCFSFASGGRGSAN